MEVEISIKLEGAEVYKDAPFLVEIGTDYLKIETEIDGKKIEIDIERKKVDT